MLNPHFGALFKLLCATASGVHGNAGQANYGASKADVVGLTQDGCQRMGSQVWRAGEYRCLLPPRDTLYSRPGRGHIYHPAANASQSGSLALQKSIGKNWETAIHMPTSHWGGPGPLQRRL